MSKRVAKEIKEVVNKFYPSLENHFVQFKNLDNSFGELVSKFVTLEGALDYAVKLDPNNLIYHETGYNLCRRVIGTPKAHALADYGDAMIGVVIGSLQGNKYTSRDAISKGRNATALKDLINQATRLVFPLEEKYIENINKLNPSYQTVSSRGEFFKSKEGREMEVKELMAKEGFIAAFIHSWNTQVSTFQKIAIIFFLFLVLLYIISA